MKVKCPKCNHEFEAIENPAPVLQIPQDKATTASSYLFSSSIKSLEPVMKKGYGTILGAIEKHDGATWTELKNETGLHHVTLSNRLKEGKQVGIIGESIRKQNGKKIYTLK